MVTVIFTGDTTGSHILLFLLSCSLCSYFYIFLYPPSWKSQHQGKYAFHAYLKLIFARGLTKITVIFGLTSDQHKVLYLYELFVKVQIINIVERHKVGSVPLT